MAEVEPEQELGATYIEPFASRSTRRKRLQDRFGFLCSCPACSMEGNELQVAFGKTGQIYWISRNINKNNNSRSSLPNAEGT